MLIISLVQYQQYKNIIVLDPCKTYLLSKVWLYQTPAIQPIGEGGGGGGGVGAGGGSQTKKTLKLIYSGRCMAVNSKVI